MSQRGAEPAVYGQLPAGTPMGAIKPLFPRIETEKPAAAVEGKPQVEASPGPPKPAAEGLIEIADFAKVQLRTAKIIAAERVPGADKLLKLNILVGEERRQLVAGIALHYTPEEVIGKTVIVVANLKPAKIRGVDSQGMLLAASKGEKLTLVTVDGEISSGAQVK